MRLSNDNDEKRISQLLDTYFLDQPAPSTSTWLGQLPPQISYQGGTLVTTANVKGVNMNVKVSPVSPDKAEKERLKKARQAEAARMRYHRLTPAEKRELNLKRTLAQKRKRQREKELEELESILRETNDIQEDPDITEQLREKRMRAKWAEAARQRYARMTPEERRAHNNRRRMRQMQNALAAVKVGCSEFLIAAGGTGDPIKDEEAVRAHIKAQNAKKAEAARQRYHRMTEEEKRIYNQRRTEAFRRRRMEEEMLLAMPIGRINGEALDRAQQIVVRNAKRAEAARLRYQRMTPDQRKSYNQKRYTPKRRRLDGMDSMLSSSGGSLVSCKKVHLTFFSVLLSKFTFRLNTAIIFVNPFAAASSFAVRRERRRLIISFYGISCFLTVNNNFSITRGLEGLRTLRGCERGFCCILFYS
ncbi:unnamed protein product [Angiostrongylus costaricensis]|uniref:Coiled-coil domain-containing protein n=1 Tax=Angiostrongylus costaricensis TaxID=334426 RepID=A0A158PH37_ANGCS|nr:unnamed protein product [Angiostrongylus costaricensis]